MNAANNQLHMGGGVAAALRSRGGIAIHQEAIKHAPAEIGAVVRTGAGKLSAKYVYHAVVIDYDVSKGTAASDVSTVVHRLLDQAKSDNIDSMCLPLFGAGVGGLSIPTSLNAILDTIENWTKTSSRALKIEIVIWDQEEYSAALSEFQKYEVREVRAKEEDRIAEEYLDRLLKNRKE